MCARRNTTKGVWIPSLRWEKTHTHTDKFLVLWGRCGTFLCIFSVCPRGRVFDPLGRGFMPFFPSKNGLKNASLLLLLVLSSWIKREWILQTAPSLMPVTRFYASCPTPLVYNIYVFTYSIRVVLNGKKKKVHDGGSYKINWSSVDKWSTNAGSTGYTRHQLPYRRAPACRRDRHVTWRDTDNFIWDMIHMQSVYSLKQGMGV